MTILVAHGKFIGFAYPIIDGILILLPSLALVMPGEAQAAAGVHLAADTDSVMSFYDEVGWQSSKDAGFQDAELFEDFRRSAANTSTNVTCGLTMISCRRASTFWM